MCEFHNTLFRGFDALYLQAPYVSSSDPVRAANFLFYSATLCSILHIHHDWEEVSYFPALERIAGKPGLFQVNVVQHDAFEKPLAAFEEWCLNTKGEDYDAETYQKMIMAFASPLDQHMRAEPATFLGLKDTDTDELMKVYKEQEKVAMAKGDLQK